MSSEFGLSLEDRSTLNDIFSSFPEIEKVVVFGSRAKGTHKMGSDVDLAIYGNFKPELINQVWGILENESPLPYQFDLVAVDDLIDEALLDHINRVGKVFYEGHTAD